MPHILRLLRHQDHIAAEENREKLCFYFDFVDVFFVCLLPIAFLNASANKLHVFDYFVICLMDMI